ncbi:MAG TPA: glutathione S-transferase N-terminal domain-containing protein [Thermoleophilaceae bacterium]|nr:glutathione S-transferase N-terminal domain-containing protein [Thermoleophilaceae bacterium]
MELYVCWGTFKTPRPGGHPCRNAHEALRAAGWDPKVTKVHGLGPLPDALSSGRKKVRELTGQSWVPVLVTDDAQVIQESARIVEWAEQHPAATAHKPG